MELKTVIALPDEVFAAAEVLARRLGLSRGALYAEAVAEFVACQRRRGVTERLDAVSAQSLAPDRGAGGVRPPACRPRGPPD